MYLEGSGVTSELVVLVDEVASADGRGCLPSPPGSILASMSVCRKREIQIEKLREREREREREMARSGET